MDNRKVSACLFTIACVIFILSAVIFFIDSKNVNGVLNLITGILNLFAAIYIFADLKKNKKDTKDNDDFPEEK